MPPSPCLAFASPSHQAAAPPTQRPTSSCSEPLSPWPSPFSTYDAGPKSLLYASPTSPSAPAYNLPASRSADKKNDQVGEGSVSRLPSMPGWGLHCRATLLQEWVNLRSAVADTFDHFARISKTPTSATAAAPDALFITLSGPRWGLPLSAEAVRSQHSGRFTPAPYNRIPSPRKGGTQWYAALGTPRAVTQAQGAWKTPAVVDSIYDGPEEAGRLREIVLAASRGPDALALQDALVALQSDAASIHTTDRDGADSFSSQLVHKLHTLRHLFSEDAVSTFAPDSASRIRRLKKHAPDDDKALLVDIASAFTLLTKRGHHAVATATGKATLPAPLLSAPARPYSRSRRLHQKTHCPR